MHTRSRVQHLAPAMAGQTLTVGATFIEAYERKGHHFGVLDCLVLGPGRHEAGAHAAHDDLPDCAPGR